MFVAKARGDPDNGAGLGPCCICEELPEMSVVCLFELILDDQLSAIGDVASKQIE